jgi:type IV pilus assembly protein PilQ
MGHFIQRLAGGATLLLAGSFISVAQTTSSPAPVAVSSTTTKTTTGATQPVTVVQASNNPAAPAPTNTSTTSNTATTTAPGATPESAVESGGVGVREFQGDDVGQVLRLLARQAKINMVVSDQLPKDSTVTMRLEDVTALQAIAIIVKAKGLFMDKIDNVYYVKTEAERAKEPTESDSYQFSYSRAKDVAPLVASQLASKDPPQIDERTNTIFFRETRSNIDNVRKMLVTIDKPTKQVMIEARLVEVTANPKQSYGINWGGVFGSSTSPQTFKFGGTTPGSNAIVNAQKVTTNPDGSTTTQPLLDVNGFPVQTVQRGTLPQVVTSNGAFSPQDLLRSASNLAPIGGQFAILSVPQMSATLRLLNEDSDAEFLSNPRVVTADNQQAKIEITRNQPVPQLNFNEQTATAVFGGFQDKKFGNTLIVRPSVNKDNFVTLSVKPEISNKVGDATFAFAGATVASPVIDTRSLESNVLIKSSDTLAIGGLLQDENTKGRTKVPVLGDIPVLGYLFQEHLNARTKRNLLVFVTPTIIDSRYGTGLEDQASGLHHVGEEYADPNGWRNNAKGAVRLVPTSNRQNAADYPKPGAAPPPDGYSESTEVQFKSSTKDRD